MTTTELSIETLVDQLRDLVLELHQHNAREIATDYAYLLTKGEREKLLSAIQEFQEMLGERNSDQDTEE